MTAAMYREFILRDGFGWPSVAAFLKSNARSVWERGKFLQIIISEEDRKRTSEQNRFYWKVIIGQIAESGWINGRQYRREVWHEYLAQTFLPREEMVLPSGEIIQRRKSTTELNVGEFSEYIEKCRAYAAVELGIEFDA